MTPAEYRKMLTDALNKPIGPKDAWALTITGALSTGLGARGELICDGPNGPVRAFTRPQVKRMLDRFDSLAAAAAIPTPVIHGNRITISCEPCGFSVDAANNDFGRLLVAAWPAAHAPDCKAAKKAHR